MLIDSELCNKTKISKRYHERYSLTHFSPVSHFCFLTFLGGIEM